MFQFEGVKVRFTDTKSPDSPLNLMSESLLSRTDKPMQTFVSSVGGAVNLTS